MIKSLGQGLGATRFLSGAAILADGRVGLIINVEEIAGTTVERRQWCEPRRSAPAATARESRRETRMNTTVTCRTAQAPGVQAMAAPGRQVHDVSLANEDYGLAILKVREIIGLMDITRVPCTDSFIRGVINLRGKVIPGDGSAHEIQHGALPDHGTDGHHRGPVRDHTEARSPWVSWWTRCKRCCPSTADKIEPPPNFGASSVSADFILGIGKADKRVIFLLDIGRVLSGDEAERMVQAVTV